MKGFIKRGFLAITGGLLVLGCATEVEPQPEMATQEAMPTMALIPTLADYEALVDQHSPEALSAYTQEGFVSLGTAVLALDHEGQQRSALRVQQAAEAFPEGDDFFLSLLNQDQMVAIDRWVFKLDFDNQLVFAMERSQLDYTALQTQDLSHEAMQVFTFQEDVLDLVQVGKAGRAEWCRNANDSEVSWNIYLNETQTWRTKDTKTKYYSAGIYYTLKTEITVQYFTGLIWKKATNADLRIDFPHDYQVKCGAIVRKPNAVVSQSNVGELEHYLYKGTRKLSDIECETTWTIDWGNQVFTKTRDIDSNLSFNL